MPRKEHGGYHQIIMVVGFPWDVVRIWIVENEANLPEPGSLEQKSIAPGQGTEDIMSVLHFQNNSYCIEGYRVNQKRMQKNIQMCSAMQMKFEKKTLNSDGQNVWNII